ncbi:ThiF family adenylyltransferase [Photobacterium chitinilyticum]|uniref:ThiF family adenylyltransferase n=1 Tax=Photobacterium chitinilyticum TaxID=2485123 RepID=A0A3S3RXR7_9GAMM|nr:ThiF family adenylyltransferase [Photobacterium chitinilyticum]RWX52887.1 ThiF family adenylyltransferase [Photobacterium chitinilyticum]
MSQQLISLSPDLKQLQDEGYEVAIIANHLVISHVPYVTSQGLVEYGRLVSELTLSSNRAIKPSTHVIDFEGEFPCHKNGEAIEAIRYVSSQKQLAPELIAHHSFSNKPPQGYADYYEKVTRYLDIISNPAKSLDPSCTAKTFKVIHSEEDENVFNYLDTNSSRAGINMISRKLNNQKIAIVGLGGTGAYILDLIAKSPVKEIHLFDGDEFIQHNAFRTPGAATEQQLDRMPKKVDYLKEIYSGMRKGIIANDFYLTPTNMDALCDFDFVFISIDKGDIKREIFTYLENHDISFVDVGIGVEAIDDQLIGMVRTTASSPKQRSHIGHKVSFEEGENAAYTSNIQIAELNALNASLAVIKWKKLAGFYQDLNHEHHSVYTINVDMLTDEDHATQIC